MDRLTVITDKNKHIMDGKLRNMSEAERAGLVEFSHKSWGVNPPNTYINGKCPIDAGYRSSYVKVTHSCMILFINSPGNHKACVINIITRSMIGEHPHKTDFQRRED